MASLTKFRQTHPALWALLCLLLVISFLYNPYLQAQVSSGELNVRHPFSNRATVGASELEKYASMASETGHVVMPCLPLAFSPAVLQSVHFFPPGANEQIPPQVALRGSVWFRPPPVL